MHNWDDLRLFLATARAGSARAGARALGVNQSTVSRRIAQLEERSGFRLFDRRPGGLELTDAGDELLSLAAELETRIAAMDRQLQGRETALRGAVRLTLPDFAVAAIARHLAHFAELYPLIEIQVIVDNGFVSLAHREADVALRLAGSPPDELIGRRLATARMGIYTSAAKPEANPGAPVDLSQLDWIRWDEPWRGLPTERWISANIPNERVRARVNTSLASGELVALGVGVGFKLCYVGDSDPRLRRIGPPIDFGFGFWALTHRDLKRTARVRALLRFLGDALAAEADRFVGPEDPAG